MKRAIFVAVVLLMVLTVMPASANDKNGLDVNGWHFTLNMIGVQNPKNASMDCSSGSRMFVGLGKAGEAANTKINLSMGDYQVLDCNGTDGTAAFQLPNPDPDGDGTTAYSVYVRALGKPGRYAKMQTCATDLMGDTYCAVDIAGGVEQITIGPRKGQSIWDNVSKDLLYVDICVAWDINDVCTAYDQVPLFSAMAEDYYWDYDNYGLKLAQFRFYPVPTDTPW